MGDASSQGADIMRMINEEIMVTDVTSKIHRSGYPAVSPKRPRLSQAGRTILIPGGGQGVGFAIAKSFIAADAAMIILVGRRLDALASTAGKLREIVKETGGEGPEIIVRSCDIADAETVNAFWDRMAREGVRVDVLVHSAVNISAAKPMLELGGREIWSQFETNVKGAILFAEKFIGQSTDRQRFIVDVSTAQIHGYRHALTKIRPAYTLTKTAQHMYFQLLADEVSPDQVQIVSFHPGLIFNDEVAKLGIPKDALDDDSLPGDCAVWMASKEAEFLHGRMIWSRWDVEELQTGSLRKRIEEDEYFLRVSLGGLKRGKLIKIQEEQNGLHSQ